MVALISEREITIAFVPEQIVHIPKHLGTLHTRKLRVCMTVMVSVPIRYTAILVAILSSDFSLTRTDFRRLTPWYNHGILRYLQDLVHTEHRSVQV